MQLTAMTAIRRLRRKDSFSLVLNYETGPFIAYNNVELNPLDDHVLFSGLVETNPEAVYIRTCPRFVYCVDFRID